MTFTNPKFRSKKELLLEKLEAQVRGLEERIDVVRRKIMEPSFLAGAGIQETREALLAHKQLTGELQAARKKLNEMGNGR